MTKKIGSHTPVPPACEAPVTIGWSSADRRPRPFTLGAAAWAPAAALPALAALLPPGVPPPVALSRRRPERCACAAGRRDRGAFGGVPDGAGVGHERLDGMPGATLP